MDLNNSFEVARPIDEAWAVLTDLERIAPCLPGAQLTEVEGDDYRGFVKVKVGPITAQFKGAANFVERNDADHTAVLSGKGRDTRGAGNASALITAKLEEVSDSITRVNVDTDMKITGKFAQFGRGVMADVSANLMDQFAQNLAEMLAADNAENQADRSDGAAEAVAVDASSGGGGVGSQGDPEADTDSDTDPGTAAKTTEPDGAVRRIEMPEPEAIDLIDAAGAPVMKRVATVAAVVVAFLLLRRLLRRSR